MPENRTYEANKQAAEQGFMVLEKFREETRQPMERTTALLLKLLDDNKDTEYGKRYGFADIRTVGDYQKKVPVITYDEKDTEVLETYFCGRKTF